MTGEETLLDLFARTVAEFPDRPAVSDDSASLSYAELDARSTALARVLAGHGVRGERVAIYRERGVDVFVSVLGVLKAGAAYVAIDTRYPDSRRDLMIRGGHAAVVVTEPGWRPRLGPLDAVVLEWRSAPVGRPEPPATPVRGDDPACVLFTSGSSGTPKAIVVEHRNLLFFARNPALPALTPADRTGQVSSLSFDAFHFEMWCSFAHGAEVVVLPAMAELIAGDLQRELRRRRVTVLLAPTMAVNHVVHEDRDAFAPLRVLLTGGDVVQPAACRALLAGSFAGEFVNLYGPAEGTTACTAYRVGRDLGETGSVPIGTALAGAAVRVLDSALREVPAGAVGELHISGPGVAAGYSDQPALTAERFVPDPFGPPGARMYATGDLGRQRRDGLLEFAGRADDQVKIRGYRVEPREVERILTRHPAVLEVAVVAVGTDHDRRLVAVVACDRLPLQRLREFAAGLMPDYLVPSAFVAVSAIPGDEHGKRDLRRIEALAGDQVRRQAERVPPRDEVERYLAGLWERLLAVEWVGLTDDFFALGGNSMLAFRVHRRIGRDLDVRLDVRDVLENGELARLAELIRMRKGEESHGHAVAGR